MPPLPRRAIALLSLALVPLACSTTSSASTCPSGNSPTCFGSASDTCYCTPVSTCDYCAALFNARPTDPDPLCAPYRSVVPCTGDIECPAGEACLTGDAASGGGVCSHACTAAILYLDGGIDAASFGDSGLDASALSSLENACVSYYAELQISGACQVCVQSQIQECATVDASSCDPSSLQVCADQCNASGDVTTIECACIAACLGPCAAEGGAFYTCVTEACGDSCSE